MLMMLLRGLIRLALLALLGYLLYRFCLTLIHAFRHNDSHHSRRKDHAATMALDPECGNYIHENDALKAEIDGRHYFFCSRECRDAFLAKQR